MIKKFIAIRYSKGKYGKLLNLNTLLNLDKFRQEYIKYPKIRKSLTF